LSTDELKLNNKIRFAIESNLEVRKEYYESLINKFFNLKQPGDLALLIGFQHKIHINYLMNIYNDSTYKVFYIPKKSGGFRTITAPDQNLKLIQSRLNFILNLVYKPKASSHGFVFNKNIVTNANAHVGKSNVLNIDLKDFFPSINFGRTRGVFIGKPYSIPDNIATIIANICCFDNSLPQGAPTSPVISNLICSRLDQKLIKLAKENFCFYTRYADDITFSNSKRLFPEDLTEKITNIINEEGFNVNEKKIRLQSKYKRQEVTGITVNKKLNISRKYIKNIRAILHNCRINGIELTTKMYNEKYSKFRLVGIPDFLSSLKGKIEFIGMVRGKSDEIYNKYLTEFYNLTNQEIG